MRVLVVEDEAKLASLLRRRRRLPREAVLVRRADGADPRADAPRRPAPADRAARRRAAPRPGHPPRLARRGRAVADVPRVRAARDLHAPPGAGAEPVRAAR